MSELPRWFGKAFCTVDEERDEYNEGYRGATFVFACLAPTLTDCVALLKEEAGDNGLDVRGLEYLMQEEYMDRELSTYEENLASKLQSYPLQFENVHFFLPDG